ncbi:MAG: malate dehydrogenase [Abditibacteriota bacterium]|nr:malate dehydrogenase [Abditibacteriota bacterium]
MKVTIIGAGNVGATAASVLATKNVASRVVMLDVREGFAEGKAMDMMQTSHMLGNDTVVEGCTNDFSRTAGSSIVVITSGIARKPGMSREDLIGINAGIVKDVAERAIQASPDAIFIVVSNPADTLTYLTLKETGLPKNRVMGMTAILDSSRFIYFLAQAIGCPTTDVEGMVIGSHGDSMVPLARYARYQGISVRDFLSKSVLDDVINKTKNGGALLTKLVGTSAWYAPGVGIATMAEAILHDSRKMISCSVYLDGEYGEKDVCVAVPAILGANGVEKIITLPLNEKEKELFRISAANAHESIAKLKEILAKK